MNQTRLEDLRPIVSKEICEILKKCIDLSTATSLNNWCKLYREKYGKNSTGAEQNHQLAIHPEWMDEYGRKAWEQHKRRERNGK